MEKSRFGPWRALFVISGVLIVIGGMNHPRGHMAQMLVDPDWVWSHSVLLLGFLALLGGLVMLRRSGPHPTRTARWLRLATIGTVLQAIEMAVHTVAVVDGQHLVEGAPTPVLDFHLVLSVLFYPFFAVTMIGLIVASSRDRSFGTPWVSWLGILGAAAHGLAPLVVVALPALGGTMPANAQLLFPMLILLALWLVITGLGPRRSPAVAAMEPAAPAGSGL